MKAALFHEGLTLLQRDRNAAFFAEEDGARILICSEIGSEGRNFQFAHHLVLFDLPADPELLEQRIGRLDRIGQTATITIHVPYLRGTESEVLARWYHEGLNAFEMNPHGAVGSRARTGGGTRGLVRKLRRGTTRRLPRTDSRTARRRRAQTRARSRPAARTQLLQTRARRGIDRADSRRRMPTATFEDFFIRLLDHFGVHVEELGTAATCCCPAICSPMPSPPARGRAHRHLRSRARAEPRRSRFHERRSSAACAARSICCSAWNPATLRSVSGRVPEREGDPARDPRHRRMRRAGGAARRSLPSRHADARRRRSRAAQDHTDDACARRRDAGERRRLPAARPRRREKEAAARDAREGAGAAPPNECSRSSSKPPEKRWKAQLDDEIERLEDLRELNDHVRPEEIAAVAQQKADLVAALATTPLRLDAVRLIWRMP